MKNPGYSPLLIEDIEPQIQRSWHRSNQVGLEKHKDPGFLILNRKTLNEKRANYQLQKYSQSLIPKYGRIIRDSQTRVCVCDAEGFILDSWGCDDFLPTAEKVALLPGVSWHEETRGTNAIGTAIAENKPAIILGDNHYLQSIHKVSCAGSPIIDGQGRLVGVIDISGNSHCFRFENIYLSHMMSMDLENRLLLDQYRKLEYIELSWVFFPYAKGLLFFNDKQLVAANKVAGEILQLPYPFDLISGEDIIEDFLALRDHPGDQKLIRPRDGYSCYARFIKNRKDTSSSSHAVQRKKRDPRISKAQMQGVLAVNRNIPLLVTGETGVGKEWMVKKLHQMSERRLGKLVIVNCCSLPEQLVESELFGYVGGAFTGANPKGSEGYLLQADGGILFLDEIADLSPQIQAKLLRVLQEKTITPVGSNKTYKLDFCLVSATHKDLKEEVRQGRFREDLCFRINGVEINVPPLRERSDFLSLVNQLLTKYGNKHRISPDLMTRLMAYAWPGNIRQLDHLINIACAFAAEEKEIIWDHLPDNLKHELQASLPAGNDGDDSRLMVPEKKESLESKLVQISLETYRANGANVSKTARELGISRNTLYKRLRQAGIVNSKQG